MVYLNGECLCLELFVQSFLFFFFVIHSFLYVVVFLNWPLVGLLVSVPSLSLQHNTP